MNNYQLYKTSILLSGQLKWDLIIDTTEDDIYIGDFHITPISKYVPYNRYSKDNLLNYKHQNNIKVFYNKIISSFYENFNQPQMNHNWPIIDDSKNYDDTFYSGCSRMDYNIYEKQFEYFCPIWIEKLGKNNHIVFDIYIKLPNSENIIASRSISLNLKNNRIFHNRFVNYLNEYLDYIGVVEGSDDVININLEKYISSLRGIDVTSGNLVTRTLPSLIYNLLSRERPLLESDYMITTSYKDTKTIVPNIFNFNICFNIDDVFTKGLAVQLHGKPLIIGVDVKIVDDNDNLIEILEKRDIYTNYDYIPKKYCEDEWIINNNEIIKPTPPESPNVLNYIYDNKYIGNIDKNKIVQKIPHWQLVDNDDYIFNVYEGFRGFFDETLGSVKNNTYITEQPVHSQKWIISNEVGYVDYTTLIMKEEKRLLECYARYADTPDIIQDKYSKSLNNLGWANYVRMNSNTFTNIVAHYTNTFISDLATTLKSGWVGNLYYDYKKDDSVKVILGYIDKKIEVEKIKNLTDSRYTIYYPSAENIETIITVTGFNNDVIIISSINRDNLTFAGFKKLAKIIIENYKEENQIIEDEYSKYLGDVIGNKYISLHKVEDEKWIIPYGAGLVHRNTLNIISETKNGQYLISPLTILYNIMDSVKPLTLVSINNRLGIIAADSPSLNSKEIDYKKLDNESVYMSRYDGKIKPCMLTIENLHKNYIYNKKYLKDISDNDNFRKYVNSGYQPLYPSIGYWAYEDNTITYDKPLDFVLNTEYKWFDNSKILYTKPVLSFVISSEYNDINSINLSIKNHIKNITNSTDEIVDYMFDMYNIIYDFIGLDDKNYFKYNINMKFK